MLVADARETILAPVIGAGSGLIMSEVVPGVSIVAVVLADRTPLPLAQIRAPLSPGNLFRASFFEPEGFGGHTENQRCAPDMYVCS